MNKFSVKHKIIGLLLVLASGYFSSLYCREAKDEKYTIISDTVIFPQGTFEACHASTIVELTPGMFMASWFAGAYEGANDVAIWTSIYKDNNWSFPVKAASGTGEDGKPMPCWNPVLFKNNEGILYLFYKVGPNPREWRGMFIRSADDGKTWSSPEELPENILGPIRNKPIQLSNGNILCPSSVESIDAGKWTVHLEITDAKLKKWEKIEINADDSVGVIQPTILQHAGGKLQMLCRSRQNVIYETWSTDEGKSWSRLSPTKTPNPNSGIDAVTLKDGGFILIYNPLLQGKDWFYGRNVLNAAFSNDGENWKDICQLENEKEGEFSYPAVIQASDGTVHITYTDRRKNIRHVVLKKSE
jgi:alpha-L-fucosidase